MTYPINVPENVVASMQELMLAAGIFPDHAGATKISSKLKQIWIEAQKE